VAAVPRPATARPARRAARTRVLVIGEILSGSLSVGIHVRAGHAVPALPEP
jgi:hypothetical protein